MKIFTGNVKPLPVPKRTGGRERKEEKKTLYLCDGNDECSGHGECYKIGGHCRHTNDINHAKNFHQYKGMGPWCENVPDQTSDVKEIRGRIVLKGVKEFKQELNNVKELRKQLEAAVSKALVTKKAIEVKQELRGTDAGISLRSILEKLKSVDQNAAGKTKINIIIEKSSIEGRKLKEALQEVLELKDEHPDIKMNIEVHR